MALKDFVNRYLKSWNVLLATSVLYVLVSIGIIILSASRGESHAAGFAVLAGMLLLGISIVATLISVGLGYYLKRGMYRVPIGIFVLLSTLAIFYFSGGHSIFMPMIGGYLISVFYIFVERKKEVDVIERK